MLKYIRLTIGQLKCASKFLKKIISARRGHSHEIHCAPTHCQTFKSTITHMKVNSSFLIT